MKCPTCGGNKWCLQERKIQYPNGRWGRKSRINCLIGSASYMSTKKALKIIMGAARTYLSRLDAVHGKALREALEFMEAKNGKGRQQSSGADNDSP